MKQLVIAGTLVGALALAGAALAQQSYPAAAKPQPQTPSATTPAAQTPTASQPATTGDQTEKTAKTKQTARRHTAKAEGENASGTHVAPKQQPNTTPDPAAPEAALALGSVHIPMSVKADGKPLAAGTYQVRLTPDEAKPDAKGASEKLERWVEFTKGGKVVGREVVSIVPANEAKLVQKDTPPHSGGSKFEALKGGDYHRLWINKGGNYYLVHFAS